LALSAKEERELVTKLEDMFQSAVEHPSWQEWRSTIAPKCFRYREGDQWTAGERATLKKRHQPEITNNQVAVTINRLVGQFVKQQGPDQVSRPQSARRGWHRGAVGYFSFSPPGKRSRVS
jgi:hypothetical protein